MNDEQKIIDMINSGDIVNWEIAFNMALTFMDHSTITTFFDKYLTIYFFSASVSLLNSQEFLQTKLSFLIEKEGVYGKSTYNG